MKFIELVAHAYCKEEAEYTAAWLDAVMNGKPLNRRDRSRPIWHWALKRWGPEVWPHMEYRIRTHQQENRRTKCKQYKN